MSSMDARIPVVFATPGAVIPPETAVLSDDHAERPGAMAVARFESRSLGFSGCACCAPRGHAARSLGALFQDRARGKIPFFRQVLVFAADASKVRAELAGDVLVSARYRVERA